MGLSLHLRVVVTRRDVEGLARVTLTGFGVALVAALMMVVPRGNDASSVGWDLVGLGAAALVIVARSVVAGFRGPHRTLGVQRLVLRFGVSALSFLAVIAVGGVLVAGDFHDGLAWFAGVAIFLLLTTLRNSWDLLVSVGAAIQTAART